MPMSPDSDGKLRAAFAARMLAQARESAYGGAHGVLVRVAMVTLFAALVVVSNELMGVTGLVFVATLVLIVLLFPVVIPLLRRSARTEAFDSDSAGSAVEPDPVARNLEAEVSGKARMAKSASEA